MDKILLTGEQIAELELSEMFLDEARRVVGLLEEAGVDVSVFSERLAEKTGVGRHLANKEG